MWELSPGGNGFPSQQALTPCSSSPRGATIEILLFLIDMSTSVITIWLARETTELLGIARN